MSKTSPLSVFAPATQRTLKTAALTASGDRLIRTDIIELDKNENEELWAQLNAVYVAL